MRFPLYILFSLVFSGSLFPQSFPPAAGLAGSTAIHMDSPVFIAWADSCIIERGPAIITVRDSLEVTNGMPADATGKAGEGRVVSLGDGGTAALYFDPPVTDGPGWDFAVFENAFSDNFLELAFVEVSSDGINYLRFPAESLTPADVQTGSFGTLDPVNINGLAGKYRAGYGTPFDLADIDPDPGIDRNSIRWIRVRDVIGCIIDSIGSRDIQGRIINDPWPTVFPTGGFDLDAVGIINNRVTVVPGFRLDEVPDVYPNPFTDCIRFTGTGVKYSILNLDGTVLLEGRLDPGNTVISLPEFPAGCYLMVVDGTRLYKLIKTK